VRKKEKRKRNRANLRERRGERTGANLFVRIRRKKKNPASSEGKEEKEGGGEIHCDASYPPARAWPKGEERRTSSKA